MAGCRLPEEIFRISRYREAITTLLTQFPFPFLSSSQASPHLVILPPPTSLPAMPPPTLSICLGVARRLISPAPSASSCRLVQGRSRRGRAIGSPRYVPLPAASAPRHPASSYLPRSTALAAVCFRRPPRPATVPKALARSCAGTMPLLLSAKMLSRAGFLLFSYDAGCPSYQTPHSPVPTSYCWEQNIDGGGVKLPLPSSSQPAFPSAERSSTRQ
jgi:hypothetical protein